MEIQMYKTFPQEKLRVLITKLQKLMNNKHKYNQHSYLRKYNDIMKDLYPLLQFIQYVQINKNVVHLNNTMKTSYSNIQEGYGDYQEDLVIQQVEQMINYIPKIDLKHKRLSDVLYIIQIKSTRIYFYSTITSPQLRIYPLDTESETNTLLEDKEDDKVVYNIEEIEDRFKEISKNIYYDYITNKITYTKFSKFSFLIKLLYFFIHEDKKSDQFIDVYNTHITTKGTMRHVIRLIYNIYSQYQKRFITTKKHKLNVGISQIDELIIRYFNLSGGKENEQ